MTVIGATQLRDFSFSSPLYVENPYDYCKTLQQAHPVFFSAADNCFVASRFDDVKSILNDYETFSSDSGVLQKRVDREEDYGFAPIFMLSPPRQTRLRKLAAPAFSLASAQHIEVDVVGAASKLLEEHAHMPVFDVIEDFATPLTVGAIVRLLGIEGDTAARLGASIRLLTLQDDCTQHADTSHLNLDDVALSYKKMIAAHYESVKAGDARGFSARLVEPDKSDDRLADREAFGMFYLTAIAGVEDVIRSIANVLVALWQNTSARESVCRNTQSTIANAIFESLRLYPSSHFVRRTATRDVEISGVRIPAGSNVIAWIAAANRDPTVFDEPEKFRLHRDNVRSALTFGAGPHICIGKHIGRIIIRSGVSEFLKKHPSYALDLENATKTHRGMILGYRTLPALKQAAPRTQPLACEMRDA